MPPEEDMGTAVNGDYISEVTRRAQAALEAGAITIEDKKAMIKEAIMLGRPAVPVPAVPVPAVTLYKEADLDILFDELLEVLDDYVFRSIPMSVRKTIEDAGRTPDLITVFGPERLRSTFCKTYADALTKQLYIDVSGEAIEGESGVTEDSIVDMIEWVESKCVEYTAAVKTAKKSVDIDHRGIFHRLRLDKKLAEELIQDVETPTQEELDQVTFSVQQFRDTDAVLKRITAYLQGVGYFLLYLGLTNTKISDVDATFFTHFQDLIKDNYGTAPETLNKYARDCKIFFTQLASQEYMKPIPRKGRGSIPPRHYEAGATIKKPHAAFELTITGKGVILPDDCETCKLYRCLRSPKMKKYPHLKRDPKLIEICMRINRETGLRSKFLLNLTWGDFKKDPVKTMPKGQPVYQLKLGRIRESVRHTKQLADKDMYISGLLGKMMAKYREKHTEVLDHYKVFNGVLLFGESRERTYTTSIDAAFWRREVVEPIESACGINALPMKFRNSYYTIMLDALNYVTDKEFKAWTGDRVDTAEMNYKAAEGVVNLPESHIHRMSYSDIVTYIFGREMVWDPHVKKWK